MKLKIDPEWLKRTIEREGDHEIGAASPMLVEQAKELARARGHKDVDVLITTEGGAQLPVWQFYLDEAAMAKITNPTGK